MATFIPVIPPAALPGISPTWGEIEDASVAPGHLSPTAKIICRNLAIEATVFVWPISPHVREMSGRTEGGMPWHHMQMEGRS